MYLKSLVVSLIVFSFSYSQTESSLICKRVDEFTDKVSYSTVDMMINYEDGGDMRSEGFVGILFLNEEKGLNDHQYIVPGAGGLGELLNNSFVSLYST